RSSPIGAVWRYDYSASGDLTTITNPLDGCTKISWDRFGNPVSLENARGDVTRYEYDFLGNLAATVDPAGGRTAYRYDPSGRLVGVCYPSGREETCAYDAEGFPTRIQDGGGNVTVIEYSGLGQIRKRILPDGSTVGYRYDTEERLIAVTNELGQEYRLGRDAL